MRNHQIYYTTTFDLKMSEFVLEHNCKIMSMIWFFICGKIILRMSKQSKCFFYLKKTSLLKKTKLYRQIGGRIIFSNLQTRIYSLYKFSRIVRY